MGRDRILSYSRRTAAPPDQDTIRRLLDELHPANTITARQRDRLARFLQALLAANQRRNLTGITALRPAVERHLIEPIVAWEALRAGADGEEAPGPIIDLGSGGGAPGLPIAILEEGRDVILVESRLRRAELLRGFVQQLGMTNVRVLAERAEVTGHGGWRERGAPVLARALAPPPIALELCLPLVAPGGRAALFLNAAARREHGDALAGAAAELGGAPPTFLELPLPSEEPLVLAMVAKGEPTPDRYPRSPAAMRRRPLA